MPHPGQDDQPGSADRLGGAPGRGRAQQRVVGTVQDEGWHAKLGQRATVPFRAGLTALRGGVAQAADLVPRGHRPDHLLVEGIGQGGDRARGRDGKREVTVAAFGEPHPRQPGHQAQVNVPAGRQAADVAGQ